MPGDAHCTLGLVFSEPGRAASVSGGSRGAQAAAPGPWVFCINCQSGEPPPVVLVIMSPGPEPVPTLPEGWFDSLWSLREITGLYFHLIGARNLLLAATDSFYSFLTCHLKSEEVSVTEEWSSEEGPKLSVKK